MLPMGLRVHLIVAAFAPLWAQQAADLRVDVDLVTVACSVSDRGGAPAKNLRLEDFVLHDNGKPQAIKYLWQESELPLTLGLLVDVSGSQMGFVNHHRETVAKFLAQVLGPKDRAFLVTVGRDVKLVTDLTGSLEELRGGVAQMDGRQRYGDQLGEPCRDTNSHSRRRGVMGCGGTALWNSIYASSRLKMRGVTGRKALIVLSDGMDTGSTHHLTDAIEAAQSAGTVVYAIKYVNIPMMLLAPGIAIRQRHGMERLTDETGGYTFPNPKDKVAEVFSRIENELRNLYVVGFTPPEDSRDGEFHKLDVRTTRKDLIVRARARYYANSTNDRR